MKKIIKILLLSSALMAVTAFTAFADFGPKPKVTIKLKNEIREEYYLDLLFQPARESWGNFENYPKIEYDPAMLSLLYSQREEGWYPVIAGGGTFAPVNGSLLPDEDGLHVFSYAGVPDEFKIIIVTKSGEVKVSEVITRKTIEADITLDRADMTYKKRPVWKIFPVQFALTCSVTLAVELILLMAFGFKLKENIKIFVRANIFTQLLFTAAFSSAFLFGGWLGCTMLFPIAEIAVTAAEAVIYSKFLSGRTKRRRILYAVCANAASALLTFVNFERLFDIMAAVIK